MSLLKRLLKKLMPEALYHNIWKLYYNMLTLIYSFYPIQKNKVLITSYYGSDYGDNGKYIVEELQKRNSDLDIVWQLKEPLLDNNHLPEKVRGVKYFSKQAVFESQTAAVWIDNSRKLFGRKRKGQFYIQTWHGGPGIKRCEKDVEDQLAKSYVRHAKRDSAMCDLILSNSTFMTNLFTNSFWYSGEVLECGTPRNDIIKKNDPEISQRVRSFFGLNSNTKLLLYAPTFRKDGNLEVYDIDLDRCCKALTERFGGEWKALLRLHPNISDKAGEMTEDSDCVISATAYSDMQELLAASDCLITDYSSSNVDFMISGKPCFLYASDLEEYRKDRGYYFKFEDFPFPLSSNNDELEQAIKKFSEEDYSKKLLDFAKLTGHNEPGTASQTVADIIETHILG